MIAAFREAAAGNSRSLTSEAIVSSVLERQNKAMAEWQFRDLLAGRPCIVWRTTGVRQTASTQGTPTMCTCRPCRWLQTCARQLMRYLWSPTTVRLKTWASMTSTAGWTSGLLKRMNAKLADLGMPQWEEVVVSEDVKQLSQWLDDSWRSEFTMLQDLLAKLFTVSTVLEMPSMSLTPDQLQQPVDDTWQKRVVAAATPIADPLGSFGPLAYSVEHVHCELPSIAGCELTWKQLRKRNDRLAQSSGYSMFDAFHGGCGGSTATIPAGIFVKAGAELAQVEIE